MNIHGGFLLVRADCLTAYAWACGECVFAWCSSGVAWNNMPSNTMEPTDRAVQQTVKAEENCKKQCSVETRTQPTQLQPTINLHSQEEVATLHTAKS